MLSSSIRSLNRNNRGGVNNTALPLNTKKLIQETQPQNSGIDFVAVNKSLAVKPIHTTTYPVNSFSYIQQQNDIRKTRNTYPNLISTPNMKNYPTVILKNQKPTNYPAGSFSHEISTRDHKNYHIVNTSQLSKYILDEIEDRLDYDDDLLDTDSKNMVIMLPVIYDKINRIIALKKDLSIPEKQSINEKQIPSDLKLSDVEKEYLWSLENSKILETLNKIPLDNRLIIVNGAKKLLEIEVGTEYEPMESYKPTGTTVEETEDKEDKEDNAEDKEDNAEDVLPPEYTDILKETPTIGDKKGDKKEPEKPPTGDVKAPEKPKLTKDEKISRLSNALKEKDKRLFLAVIDEIDKDKPNGKIIKYFIDKKIDNSTQISKYNFRKDNKIAGKPIFEIIEKTRTTPKIYKLTPEFKYLIKYLAYVYE